MAHPTNGYILLGIILGHAPNGEAQALVSRKYSEICAQITLDYESGWDREVEKAMVGILSDGLNHGNWPWVLHGPCTDPECAADHVAVRPK